MRFFYIAVDSAGKKTKGFIEANEVSRAASYLRDHSLVPIRIEQQGVRQSAGSFSFLRRTGKKDIIFFTRQIGSMLTSGLTLSQALNIFRNQTQKPTRNEESRRKGNPLILT